MSIKLLVRRVDEEQQPTEHAFEEQELITIGRDSSADLTLFDDDMMVSRLHARLELDSDVYNLSDLGSRNFTMLGDERLVPGKQYPLTDGDTFHVANYEVQFLRTETEVKDFGETRFDWVANPFLTHVQGLLHALIAIQAEYDKLPDVRKNAALSEALVDVLPQLEESSVFTQIAKEAGVRDKALQEDSSEREYETPEQPPVEPPLESPMATPPASEPLAVPVDIGPESIRKRSVERLNVRVRDGSRIDRFLDTVIDYISRQVKVPWQFKLEFIGHTFIPTKDSKGIYESDTRGLADFLFSDRCSEEEFVRRLSLLEGALDETLAHQMAILDGYREATSDGTKLMIEHMDPRKVQESIMEENIIYKYLPFLTLYRAWSVLLDKHAELAREDISVLERRTYRPAFIRSYLERMSASQESD
ncbi:MAG: hypothetical protein BMS9Abin05_2720 [Rhodothermia bacterium]|nr:MAG: hypothetical protein BMS9Abin05_2720 [Rhodothermia bacterium]